MWSPTIPELLVRPDGPRHRAELLGDLRAPATSQVSRRTLIRPRRAPNGDKFIVKLGYDATVGDLRAEIDAHRGAASPLAPAFEIRTAFPARAYNDDAATLEAAGLVPTATVLLQQLGAPPRGA